MNTAPKGIRLHIGIFGRRNVGKSSLINALTHQNISIVSGEKGTTTDPVEKPMELHPFGPVVLIDTAGLDDEGELGLLRIERTKKIYQKCDIAILVIDDELSETEDGITQDLKNYRIPYIIVFNKIDDIHKKSIFDALNSNFYKKNLPHEIIPVCARTGEGMDVLIQSMMRIAPKDLLETQALIGDIIPKNGHVILVTPVDKEAPKGRLILPQVQTIRDILDHHGTCTVCQVPQIEQVLSNLKTPPCLVVTDSQAFREVDSIVPDSIPLTSFSILFARFKGDINMLAEGARILNDLKPGDSVLIAEACTHRPIEEDIGTVKIPAWIRKKYGDGIRIDNISGVQFPDDLEKYRLIIHCGACMWNRQQVMNRIREAQTHHVPMTNYGMAIAAMLGILDRAMKPIQSN